jgi:hypothetical protein
VLVSDRSNMQTDELIAPTAEDALTFGGPILERYTNISDSSDMQMDELTAAPVAEVSLTWRPGMLKADVVA